MSVKAATALPNKIDAPPMHGAVSIYLPGSHLLSTCFRRLFSQLPSRAAYSNQISKTTQRTLWKHAHELIARDTHWTHHIIRMLRSRGPSSFVFYLRSRSSSPSLGLYRIKIFPFHFCCILSQAKQSQNHRASRPSIWFTCTHLYPFKRLET